LSDDPPTLVLHPSRLEKHRHTELIDTIPTSLSYTFSRLPSFFNDTDDRCPMSVHSALDSLCGGILLFIAEPQPPFRRPSNMPTSRRRALPLATRASLSMLTRAACNMLVVVISCMKQPCHNTIRTLFCCVKHWPSPSK